MNFQQYYLEEELKAYHRNAKLAIENPEKHTTEETLINYAKRWNHSIEEVINELKSGNKWLARHVAKAPNLSLIHI